MLAGLTAEERARLSLEGYSVDNLRYLNRGDARCNQAEDVRRFANWKASPVSVYYFVRFVVGADY